LHNAGSVHCDIKPDNLLVLNDAFVSYPCRIIDFGIAAKIGDTMNSSFSNGAPECLERLNQFNFISNKISELKQKFELVNQQIQDLNKKNKLNDTSQLIQNLKTETETVNDFINQLMTVERKRTYKSDVKKLSPQIFGKLQEYNERKKFLKDAIQVLIDTQNAHPLPTAQTTNDIYSSATLLLPILFGEAGYNLAMYLYFTDNGEESPYMHDTKVPNFDKYKYFFQKLTVLNQDMLDKTKQEYPIPMLQQFAHLQARISSPNPKERPSAIDITEKLQGIALAPYWEKIKQANYNPSEVTEQDCFLDIQW
jgi:serine/threonine protein kinase